MVINMDETKLRTIAQLQAFLDAAPEVSFSGAAGEADTQRYARFDYPQRSKRERGVVLAYLRRTSDLRPTQITRLVARWIDNPPGTSPAGQTPLRPGRPLCPQVHRQRHRIAGGGGPRQ